MKRFRLTRTVTGGMLGTRREISVIEQANDKPEPEGGEEVALETELFDWRAETPEEREAREIAEREE